MSRQIIIVRVVVFWVAIACCGFSPRLYAQSSTPSPSPWQQLFPSASPRPSPTPSPSASPEGLPTPSINMSYDAQRVGISKELGRSYFDGDVVALGGGTLVMADHIEADNEKKVLEARGHVVVISGQTFLGDKLTYHWLTGDLRITSASMMVNDGTGAKIVDKLLGFTPAELQFESERALRLSELGAQRAELIREFRKGARFGDEPDDDLIDRYVRVWEQQDLVAKVGNPALTKMGKNRLESLQRRRQFWQQGHVVNGGLPMPAISYFKIMGDTLTRTNGNDFSAYEATWTPCRCEEGDAPAWGFRADRIDAQSEGYADLAHPVLEIKGIPVLYLPFLKIPLKNQRQSGFLMPTLQTGNQANGTVYSQPLFLAFNANTDATIETDVFEKRGTKLGLELRHEQREYSGWSLKLENLRDSSWNAARANREQVADFYRNNRPNCEEVDPRSLAGCEKIRSLHDIPDPAARELAFDKYFYDSLPVPSNTWRSKQEWRGQTIIAPRLTLVSSGQVVSDHRYIEDLTQADEFVSALSQAAYAGAYAPARARLNLDGREFFLGLGTSVADNLSGMRYRYDGYQLPLQIHARSPYFSLDPARLLPKTPYASLAVDELRIEHRLTPDPYAENSEQIVLGDGSWRRAMLTQVLPLVSDAAVRVDQFAELEGRQINHSQSAGSQSRIRSWRSGIRLNLPLDGRAELADFLQPDDAAELGRRSLHHTMNWGLTFSVRPVVVRDGLYGEKLADGREVPVYFPTDRRVFTGIDESAPIEEYMVPHQRLTFSTQHSWRLFRQGWQEQLGEVPPVETAEALSMHQRARRELIYSLDRPINAADDMLSDTGQWYINRYTLEETDQRNPLNFALSLSYDFYRAKTRAEEQARNRALERQAAAAPTEDAAASIRASKIPLLSLTSPFDGPTLDLNIVWGLFNLQNQAIYDYYRRQPRSQTFASVLPPFLGISTSLGYSLSRSFYRPEGSRDYDDFASIITRSRSLSFGLNWIPRVSTSVTLGDQEVDGAPPPKSRYVSNFKWVLAQQYLDSSGCWGLRFLREKNFGIAENEATYLLQLSIIFMGAQRDQDIAAPLRRELL